MSNEKWCCRCGGQKHVYKIGGSYTKSSTGGPKVTCPLCAGTGKMKKIIDIADLRAFKDFDKEEVKDDQKGKRRGRPKKN